MGSRHGCIRETQQARPTRLAVIIPMLNEEAAIGRAISSAREADEIVVVDGGSGDSSRAVAAAHGARVIRCRPGRGRQLRCGVRNSDCEVLLFLHADTTLPAGFRAAVLDALQSQSAVWGRFDLRFDAGGPLLSLIARLVSLRSRLSRVATGDQAIFVRREALEAVGGVRERELFEDIDLTRRLKRYGRMAIPRDPVITSSRRWRADGVWATTCKMWSLKLLYLCGVPSSRLKRFYRDAR